MRRLNIARLAIVTVASSVMLLVALTVWASVPTSKGRPFVVSEMQNANVFGHCIALGGRVVSDHICILTVEAR